MRSVTTLHILHFFLSLNQPKTVRNSVYSSQSNLCVTKMQQSRNAYFSEYKKGEIEDLRSLLQDALTKRDAKLLLSGTKKVIAFMTLGIDVSPLFTDMVMVPITTIPLFEPINRNPFNNLKSSHDTIINNDDLNHHTGHQHKGSGTKKIGVFLPLQLCLSETREGCIGCQHFTKRLS